MSKVSRNCNSCAHHSCQPASQGVSVCNAFSKYALIARQHLCINYQHWQRIPKSPKREV